MPELVRLYIRSAVVGFVVSAVFTAALVWWDVAGIGRLILGSDIGGVAVLMLVVFNGIVFAAVQFAVRIMALADKGDGPRGGDRVRHPVPVPVPVSVPVSVPARRTARR
jgi:hypothetical protein